MADYDHNTISVQLREKAYELGFDLFGIAQSGILVENGKLLKEWCNSGMNADMSYLGHNVEKRIDPGLVLTGAKSVIVTGLNYYTDLKQGGNGVPVISRYAYGTDYHYVIKKKLNQIIDFIKENNPDSTSRSFVDSAPVMEKAWAARAGLGWTGKHSIIINKKYGSFFSLGVIITNLELDYNNPFSEDHCGSCRQCI
jgi:epoxyqueuosine reductase